MYPLIEDTTEITEATEDAFLGALGVLGGCSAVLLQMRRSTSGPYQLSE